MIFNIPRHENCSNCGKCCGPVPVTTEEIELIRRYLGDHPEARKSTKSKRDHQSCVFRDEDEKKCTIYPVRPMICRLMGVTKGMTCANGNTHEIDGRPFVKKKPAGIWMVNSIEW